MISVNILDEASVANAIKEIENRERAINRQTDEFLNRLADIGAETARIGYAQGADEGNTHYNVRVRRLKKSYAVTATGQDLYFLEYGAGVSAGQGYDTSVIPAQTDISPASYSATEGTGEFKRWGSWHHKSSDEKYYGLVPKKGMYLGYKAVLRNADSLAKRIFIEE